MRKRAASIASTRRVPAMFVRNTSSDSKHFSSAGAKMPSPKGDRTWLLLGASEHAVWFEALLPVLLGDEGMGAGTLAQTAALAELGRLGLGDVALLSRLGTGADLGTWDGYVAASLRAQAAGAGTRPAITGYAAVLTYVNPASKEATASYALVPETRFDWLGQDATAAAPGRKPLASN